MYVHNLLSVRSEEKMTFTQFVSELVTNLPFFVTALLVMGVIFVNGWTDAPNAIATCVSTRAMPVRLAILMAAVFNFLGVFFMTLINDKVVATLFTMVDFGDDSHKAILALSAALFAIVLWATASWYFGIPTSESHALIAGITGAAIAINGGLSGVNPDAWLKVLYGLIASTALGLLAGYLVVKLVGFLFRKADRRRVSGFFQGSQIFSGAMMAFMHGAQDGQKFMGVFLLGIFLTKNQGVEMGAVGVPLWMIILCSVLMAVGTSVGGYRIIKSVGMDMVPLRMWEGFCADLGASFVLLFASLTGVPVSTTHTKTTAIMGVGAAKRLSSVNWLMVRNMVMTWIITFPGCGLIGFLMVYLFEFVF